MNGPPRRNTDAPQIPFESFFEFSPDALVVTDGNGRITNINSQVERVFGYARAELLGLHVESLMPERFRTAHPNHRGSYSAHPSVRPMGKGLELYGRRKDGTEFPVDIMLSPVEAAGGTIFLSVIRDVSERKRAEEALLRSEHQLRTGKEQTEEELRQLVDVIPQQVFVFDADWNPLFANRREREYTGLTPQEAQSKEAVARIFHPEDLKKLQVLRERMRTEGAPFEMEARIRGKDGEYRWFLIRDNPHRDEQGRVLRWYGTRTDINERKRGGEEIRKLASLVENSMDFIGMASLEGEVLFVNAAGQRIVGLAGNEQARETKFPDYIAQPDLKRFMNVVVPIVFKDGRWEGETLFKHFQTGAFISMWQHIFFITDELSGRRLALATICRDVTERKRAEESLQRAQAQLAHVARLTTMGELVASIAHEVNQPISGMVINGNACLRWLAGDAPNLDEARENARHIVRDGKRAADVIARIRALATKTATAKERMDMNEAIREVVALSQHEVRRHGVTLRTELADNLSPVLGDRVQLQQVILNLVMNGVEAMGTVREWPRELVITTQTHEADQVRVTVQDSGIGPDPQSMERIFDAFYTTKHGGMGMGLSISRSIIQSHGGLLWAVANEGPGTTLQFTVPKHH